METFPWDDIGEPSKVDMVDHCDTIATPYPNSGYNATRLVHTRKLKMFRMDWEWMEPSELLSLVDFWRGHGSASAFYWQYPWTLFGVSGFGGPVGYDSGDGFESDVEFGYGMGVVFTTRFLENSLDEPHSHGGQYYGSSVIIEEV
jgi:hypothetical protein